MKEDKGFKEFKEKTEIIMEKDLKKIIKYYRNISKGEYVVLRELVKTSLMKDVLQMVWISAFHEGTKQSRIEYERGNEPKEKLLWS